MNPRAAAGVFNAAISFRSAPPMKDLAPAPVSIMARRSLFVSVICLIVGGSWIRRGVFRAFCFVGRVIVILARVPVLRRVRVVRILEAILWVYLLGLALLKSSVFRGVCCLFGLVHVVFGSSCKQKSTEVECGESSSYRSSGDNCSEDVIVEKDEEINGILAICFVIMLTWWHKGSNKRPLLCYHCESSLYIRDFPLWKESICNNAGKSRQ